MTPEREQEIREDVKRVCDTFSPTMTVNTIEPGHCEQCGRSEDRHRLKQLLSALDATRQELAHLRPLAEAVERLRETATKQANAWEQGATFGTITYVVVDFLRALALLAAEGATKEQ